MDVVLCKVMSRLIWLAGNGAGEDVDEMGDGRNVRSNVFERVFSVVGVVVDIVSVLAPALLDEVP